ncbi:serine hydrolase [Streptomyces shaanxiensis]|uniref:D-alanyl-D-alanine carboxypeptidase n=1 Tax=Streptomyces shaanxiensis TaxID=653357 RepID=A0ABP7UU28_9ACTN
MGDRTPDTDVLDQDDPSAERSGDDHGSGPDSAEQDNVRPSGEETAAPGSAEAAKSTEPVEEPGSEAEPETPTAVEGPETPTAVEETETPGETETPDEARKPDEPEDATDAPAEEPAEAEDIADTPEEPNAPKALEGSEGAEGLETPEGTQKPDQPEDAADAPAEEPAEPKDTADTSGQEPAEPKDAVAEPAEEADEGDAPADVPAQDAGSLPEEASDAEDDGTASDENTETPADATTADDDTAPDEGTDAAAGDDGDASDTASDTGADATIDVTGEGDDTAPAPNTDAPTEDEPEEASDAAEPEEAPGAKSPEEPAVPEGSESTRTLALRPPEASAAEVDRTMAISVADLPSAEPQDAQPQPAPTPIDLLAQLTNTPPPPATPLRTTLRRVKIWSPLVALLALVFLVVQLLRPLPDPTLALDRSASSFTIGGDAFTMPWPEEGQAAVMVVGSGTIGTFGEQKPVPTASVAKIMTAYVLLREHPLKKDEPGPDVTVDARTVEEGKSKDESRIEGLRAGRTYSLQDMLKMLMIPSGNNVARLLARWNTESEDETAFVRKMNAAAKSLGMTNTTYTDPSGLDKGTVSTAVDQLKLAEAVMRFESFRAVVAMPNADIPEVGRIYNNNDLLMSGLSVRGIKTGSNTAAGGTLSWAAYRTVDGEDRLILGSLMDQHAPPPDPSGTTSLKLVQDNSEKIIKAVREALTSATAVKKGQVVGYVDDGLGGRTPLVATKDLKVVGTPGQKLTLTLRDGGKDLTGGTKAGTVVGELAVGGGAGAQRVPVALRSELQEPSVGAKLTRLG